MTDRDGCYRDDKDKTELVWIEFHIIICNKINVHFYDQIVLKLFSKIWGLKLDFNWVAPEVLNRVIK